MAKQLPGIFTNSYKPPSVITYSSDAIILINGVDTKIVNPVSNKSANRVSFQEDVTTVSVNHSIDSAGQNSATVNIMVPRHSERQYFKYGRPVVKPMQEIEIYFKGRFLDSAGAPQYYQVFWGLVTDVGVDYSGGQHTLDITCKDILHLWDITRINTRPSLFGAAWDTTAQTTEYATIFNHLTPHEMILALSWVMMGSLLPPGEGLFPKDTEGLTRAVFARENMNATSYWEMRGRAIAKRLRLFGFSGASEGFKQFKDGVSGTITEFSQDRIDQVVAALEDIFPKNGMRRFRSSEEALSRSMWGKSKLKATKLDGSLFDRFQPFNAAGNQTDANAGEDMSRLELANQIKEVCDFEFYMDTTGDIIFKPPFYNMDVRSNDPVSIIRDSEILSFSANDNSEAIITRLDVYGQHSTYYENGDRSSQPYGSYTDYNMARQFGVKMQTIERSFLYTYELCTAYAIAELSRQNAKRFTSNMTIVGRPELRLGFPVYIESMDTFYYVVGINHTYSASGRLETALQLEAARRKHISYDQKTGEPIDGHQLNKSDTLRPVLKGAPNRVLVADPYDSIQALNPIIEKGNQAEADFALKYPEENKQRLAEQNPPPTPNPAQTNKSETAPDPDNKTPTATPAAPKTPKPTAPASKPNPANKQPQAAAKTAPPPLTKEQQEAKERAETEARRIQAAKDLEKQELLAAIAARDRALKIQEEARSRKESKTLTTNLGATTTDATAQAVAAVSSAVAGVELQSFGKLKEVIKPGVLHADTFVGIPVSDEFGYELIGGFGYGRGTKLTKTGEIVPFLTYTSRTVVLEEEEQKTLTQTFNEFSDGILDSGKVNTQSLMDTLSINGISSFTDASLSLRPNPVPDLSSRVDNLTLGNTSGSIDLTPQIQVKLGDQNLRIRNKDSSSPLLSDPFRKKISEVEVKNWINPDGVVPQTPLQYNAQYADHTSRHLGKTPNDPSGFNYRGVGKYLSDFTVIPSMTIQEDEDRFLQETFGVVKDIKSTNDSKTDTKLAEESNVLPDAQRNADLQAALRVPSTDTPVTGRVITEADAPGSPELWGRPYGSVFPKPNTPLRAPRGTSSSRRPTTSRVEGQTAVTQSLPPSQPGDFFNTGNA